MEIVEKDLSYKIVGILFEVHNELGPKYQEKYYQRAVEKMLQKSGLIYKREVLVDLYFQGEKIGKYFLDFVIENKIVLELKTEPYFTKEHYKQVRSYLQSANLELGILANFRSKSLVYKRILNGTINHSD